MLGAYTLLPWFWQDFALQTDASDVGVGAILSQKYACGSEKVVAHASRTLTYKEPKFSANEKEALAIIFGTSFLFWSQLFTMAQKCGT